jgi:hypothetical protein
MVTSHWPINSGVLPNQVTIVLLDVCDGAEPRRHIVWKPRRLLFMTKVKTTLGLLII